MLGLKIGLLTLLTIGSFVYLMQWLDRPQGIQGGEAAAEAKLPDPYEGVRQPRLAEDPARPQAAKEDDEANLAPDSERSMHVNLAFVGDVMFADKVNGLLTQHGYEYPFKYVRSYLEKADITVANLETPITTRGTAEEKAYAYRSSPLVLPELKKAGVDLVNLANNHSMDYGVQGLLDTLDHLDAKGIERVGAGRNAEEAYRHVIMEHHGMKIAFLGFSRVIHSTSWYAGNSRPGLAETYSTKLPLEAIKKAREDADLVVVIAHWGEERNHRPIKVQTDLARQYIDQGADLVVASHPHVLQGFEQYKGKWIAYSLGNFIFTTNENPATWESLILEASCTKERSCDLQLVPILTKWAQPIRMVEEDGRKLFDKLTNLSVNANIDAEGRITAVSGPPKVQAPVPDQKAAAKPANEAKKEAGETGKKANSDTKTNGITQPEEPTQSESPAKPGSAAKPAERVKAPEDDPNSTAE